MPVKSNDAYIDIEQALVAALELSVMLDHSERIADCKEAFLSALKDFEAGKSLDSFFSLFFYNKDSYIDVSLAFNCLRIKSKRWKSDDSEWEFTICSDGTQTGLLGNVGDLVSLMHSGGTLKVEYPGLTGGNDADPEDFSAGKACCEKPQEPVERERERERESPNPLTVPFSTTSKRRFLKALKHLSRRDRTNVLPSAATGFLQL